MLLPVGCNTLQDRCPWEMDLGLIEELGLVRLSFSSEVCNTFMVSVRESVYVFRESVSLSFSSEVWSFCFIFAGLKDTVLCFAQ
ncbi:hypothetical protein CsSME_00022614 [Camellia sinensis var. sinensis]